MLEHFAIDTGWLIVACASKTCLTPVMFGMLVGALILGFLLGIGFTWLVSLISD